MAVIQLPATLANQIAAGEVVARPSSVVKELMENALDAGAAKIRVEIDGGGISKIAVIDDGHGMDESDARMALRRHATSKLTRIEDLQSIGSYGFRGEALPSIASVSKLTLRTRRHDADEGITLYCEGGADLRVSPSGGAPGTQVVVAELFYNVPARRKFLRAVATEAAHVSDVVRQVALARQDVTIELTRDGRPAKRWLRVESREERVRAVLGDYKLSAYVGERGPTQIEAYLSQADRARTGAGGLSIFVCDRPVQDRALARAVATAYGDALERGRYPVGAVFVTLPRDLVDVNVHPQKAEVRFAHARAVTAALYDVICAGLLSSGGPPAARVETRLPRRREADEGAWSWSGPTKSAAEPADERRGVEAPHRDQRRPWRFVGVVREELLVFEGDDACVFVDIVQARRGMLAAKAHAQWADKGLVAQRLLFPTKTQLPMKTQLPTKTGTSGEMLRRFGFDVKDGMLHAVPRLFAGSDEQKLLAPLLASRDPEEEALTILQQMAAVAAPSGSAIDVADALLHDEPALEAAIVKRVAWSELC